MEENELKKEKTIVVPEIHRRCTDVFFLLLIICTWIVMTIIGLASVGLITINTLPKGNPQLLFHGVDYEGNVCGIDSPVANLPYRIFPNFYLTNPSSTGVYVPALFSICVSSCPGTKGIIDDPYDTYGSWTTPYNTNNFVNDCLYMNENQDNTSGTTILSDFVHSAEMIALLGFLVSVVCAFLFLFITRIPLVLRTVVWGCVFLILALFAGGGYFLLTEARDQQASDNANQTQTYVEVLYDTV